MESRLANSKSTVPDGHRLHLNRLNLPTAGNDPKLAELFAHAELRRADCAASSPVLSADWVTGSDNPRLRGAF
jgi:hypothetical protein